MEVFHKNMLADSLRAMMDTSFQKQAIALEVAKPNTLKPGDVYDLGRGIPGVTLLAHSSHRIAPDPRVRASLPFIVPERRFLTRLGPHLIQEAYERGLADSIVQLCQASGLPWSSFGIYRQGWSQIPSENAPTLLVCSSSRPGKKTFERAQIFACAVERLLDLRRLNDVHVEVVNCTPYAASDETSKKETGPAKFVDSIASVYDTVNTGRSIGPVGNPNSGTFSGFVRVQKFTSCATYGLTCHHVASIGRENGIAPLTQGDLVQLTSPSETDHAGYLESLRWRLKMQQEIAAASNNKKDFMEMTGQTWTAYLEDQLQSTAKECNSLHAILESVEASWEKNHMLGTVYMSSGISPPLQGRSINDWALIELDSNHFSVKISDPLPVIGTNMSFDLYRKVPNIRRFHTDPNSMIDFFNPSGQIDIVPAAHVRQLCKSDSPTLVYLRGRSTPFSVGILHDVRETVCTKYGDSVVVSRELVVLDIAGRDSGAELLENPTFSAGGDSGAPVRMADGKLVGIVFSSNFHDEAGRPSTFVSMAEPMLEDIKLATGAAVVSFVGADQIQR